MSKASGSFNNKMHIRVKVGDITVEVSVPSNKNADPAIIAEIARQAGEAAEKHCQAQSEKGFSIQSRGLFTFKGKNKTDDKKTESQTGQVPVKPPPLGTIMTELKVNRGVKLVKRKRQSRRSQHCKEGSAIIISNYTGHADWQTNNTSKDRNRLVGIGLDIGYRIQNIIKKSKKNEKFKNPKKRNVNVGIFNFLY